jgi:hypothetical protein
MSPTLAEPRRCDGCGDESSGLTFHRDDGEMLAKYCPGCELVREINDRTPGEHEQYELLEAIQA